MALFDVYFWPFNKPHEKINTIFVISAIIIWNVFIKFCWHNEKLTQGDTTGQTRGISEIIIHPCARRNKEKLLRLIKVKKVEVDLAILKLDSPLVFDDKVKPICLPDVSFEPGTVKGVVSGWGMTIGGTLFL